jgi:D-glycero-alpha-D-manno-heptose-7-phosphate kinase
MGAVYYKIIGTKHLDQKYYTLLGYDENNIRSNKKIIEVLSFKDGHSKNEKSIDAMHQLKEQAKMMKEALLKGKLHEFGKILDYGFKQKRNMALNISNAGIEDIYDAAMRSGATGGKISGAGGGGFMIFYCPDNTRFAVTDAILKFGGEIKKYSFTKYGLTTWCV